MSSLQDAINGLNDSIKSAKQAADWLWGLIQGDFNESQTPSQVITNAGISIALSATGVGIIAAWLLDLRDFCACVYIIYKDGSKSGGFKASEVSFLKWFLLVIMLVGLVPALGDLLKGVLRIIYLQFIRVAKQFEKLPLRQQFGKAIDASMPYIDELLQHEKVRQYLKKLGWYRPYLDMAKALKANYKSITSLSELSKIFSDNIKKLEQVFNKVKRWLPNGAEAKFKVLLEQLKSVQNGLNEMVKPLTKPLQDCIDELIIKLEKRDLATYAATSGKMSTHYYGRVAVGTKSYEQSKKLPFLIKNNKFPELVKKGKEEKYFDAVNKYKGTGTSLDVADWVIPTFNKAIVKKTINGPTTLYRVIDPASGPDGFHWVTKEVFQKLKTRDEWRDKLAVKVDWNANGQYVTMDIPKGQKIEVWSGTAASQKYDDATGLYYPGGAEQIVFNPRNSGFKISERKETPWGYVDNDENLLNNRVIINVDGSTPRK